MSPNPQLQCPPLGREYPSPCLELTCGVCQRRGGCLDVGARATTGAGPESRYNQPVRLHVCSGCAADLARSFGWIVISDDGQ